jgi:hypothetical protein
MVGLTCLYVLVFAATVGAVWYVVGCYEKTVEAEKNEPNDLDNPVDNYSTLPLTDTTETSEYAEGWAELKEDESEEACDTAYSEESLPKATSVRPMPTFYWDPEYVEEKKAKRKKKAKKASKPKSKKKKSKKSSKHEF